MTRNNLTVVTVYLTLFNGLVVGTSKDINGLLNRGEVLHIAARESRKGKIVGGEETRPYEFPWMVEIREGRRHVCGASILNPHFILTAAHCLTSDIEFFHVLAHEHNVRCYEGREQRRTLADIRLHPDYNEVYHWNDIAVAQVEPPFQFNDRVRAARLPKREDDCRYDEGTSIGWGLLDEYDYTTLPDKLRKVTGPMRNRSDCVYAYNRMYVPSTMLCTGDQGKAACRADSGGPLMFGRDRTVCGVVSYQFYCADFTTPEVSTDVWAFKDWIKMHSDVNNPAPRILEKCGGYHKVFNATILLRDLTDGERCYWTFEARLDIKEFRIVDSTFLFQDEIWVTTTSDICPTCRPHRMNPITSPVYTVRGGSSIIFLTIRMSKSNTNIRRYLKLNFTSSGAKALKNPVTNYYDLRSEQQGLTFPRPPGSVYHNNVTMLGVAAPRNWIPGRRVVVQFVRLDIAGVRLSNGGCSNTSDHLSFFLFEDDWVYEEHARYCQQNVTPGSFAFTSGFLIFRFRSTEHSSFGYGFQLIYDYVI